MTALGRAQAAAIAVAVGAAGAPALVVSSPLLRARQTAEAVADAVGAAGDIVVDERWIELDYGELEGTELASIAPELWAAWRGDPSFTPPGGESVAMLGERVRGACVELAERAARETVVVVSHVSPIKAAVAWALGVGDEVSWRMFLDVASICRLAIRPQGPSLVSFNDVAHLSPLSGPPP